MIGGRIPSLRATATLAFPTPLLTCGGKTLQLRIAAYAEYLT